MFAATLSTNRKTGNQLLNALSPNEYQKLSDNLTPLRLSRGRTLYKVGEPIKFVYFPKDSIISTVTFFDNGASAEAGIIGNEGMAGVAAALTDESAQRETSVQATGDGWQMEADKFRRHFERGGDFQHFVLRYVFAFLEQIAQSGACSHHHPIDQRLARWLLMFHDRAEGDEIVVTQDFLAQMLGVHRPGVTHAALHLKNQGLIDYKRGSLTIRDRAGIEAISCECYATIRRVYDHYLNLLDLRDLNERLESANERLAVEMRRRREIARVTSQRVQALNSAVNGIRQTRNVYLQCSDCNRVWDNRDQWRSIDFNQREFQNARTKSCVCPDCSSQSKTKAKGFCP